MHPIESAQRRGRYDRSASPSERAQRARQAILTAVAELIAIGDVGSVSVAKVLERTGLGRNTFYGQFVDLDAAVEVVGSTSLQWLLGELKAQAAAQATTPISAASSFVGAWFEPARRAPRVVLVCLRLRRADLVSEVHAGLILLHRLGSRAGVFRRELSRERMLALVAVLLELLAAVCSGEADVEQAASTTTDAILGLMR